MNTFKGLAAAALTAIMLSGCAPFVFLGVGAAAGITGVKYYEGALSVNFKASFDRTWDAAEKTLERRNVILEVRQREMGSGRLSGPDSYGRPVTVSLDYIAPEETKVVIRVGHLGDKDESVVFKEDMRKILFP